MENLKEVIIDRYGEDSPLLNELKIFFDQCEGRYTCYDKYECISLTKGNSFITGLYVHKSDFGFLQLAQVIIDQEKAIIKFMQLNKDEYLAFVGFIKNDLKEGNNDV